MADGAAPGVVRIGLPNPNGPAISMYDGARFIVPLPEPKPGALAL
jgi:hypothetical protein